MPIKIHNPQQDFYEQSSQDIWSGVCTAVKQVASLAEKLDCRIKVRVKSKLIFQMKNPNLNNYFRLHVCLSFYTSVRPYIRPYVTLSFFLIPAVVSQNFANESCLACVKSEKYVVWVTLKPLGP